MWRKKNTGFSYKASAVLIFLFLNLLLVAAPVINAASANTIFASHGGPNSQSHAADQEENNLLKHLLGDKHEYHSSRNKQRVAGVSYPATQQIISSGPVAIDSTTQYGDSGFAVRPAYYCLLFLHHLF